MNDRDMSSLLKTQKIYRSKNEQKVQQTNGQRQEDGQRISGGQQQRPASTRQAGQYSLLAPVSNQAQRNGSPLNQSAGTSRNNQSKRQHLKEAIMLLNILLLFSYMPSWLTLARAQTGPSVAHLASALVAAHQQHQHQQNLETLAEIRKAAAATAPSVSTSAPISRSSESLSSSTSANSDLGTSASNPLSGFQQFLTNSGASRYQHNYVPGSSSSSGSSTSSPSSASQSMGISGMLTSATSSSPSYTSLYSTPAESRLASSASTSSATNATPDFHPNHQYSSSLNAALSAAASPASSTTGASSPSSSSLGPNSAAAAMNQQAAAAALASLLLGTGNLQSPLAPASSSLWQQAGGGSAGLNSLFTGASTTNPLVAQALLAAAALSPGNGMQYSGSQYYPFAFSRPTSGAYQAAKYPSGSGTASSNYLAALQSFASPSYYSPGADSSASDFPVSFPSRASYGSMPYSLYGRYGGASGASSLGGLESAAASPSYSPIYGTGSGSYLSGAASSPYSMYSSLFGASSAASSPYSSVYGSTASESPYAMASSPYTSSFGSYGGASSSPYSSLFGASSSPYSSYGSSAGGAGGGAASSALSSVYSSLYGGSSGYGGGSGGAQSGHGSAGGHSFGGTPRITISPLFGSSSNSHYSYLNPYSSGGSGGGGFKSSLLGAGKIGLGLAGLSLIG